MKTVEHIAIRGGVALGVLVLTSSLCAGAGFGAGGEPDARTKSKTATIAKRKAAEQANQKRVEVTGSRLKYQVKGGEQSPATGLSVTVIDPKSPVNRGYSSPLEVLMRTPSVYRGR